MRGDEPLIRLYLHDTIDMYPTCVGMNRIIFITQIPTFYVPHMRGDEPVAL